MYKCKTYPQITIIICHCSKNIKTIIIYSLRHLIYVIVCSVTIDEKCTQLDRSVAEALIHVTWRAESIIAEAITSIRWQQ
jgi:hypothetical protein